MCDKDLDYLYKLEEFIQEKESINFNVKTFSSMNLLKEYLDENFADIVIISEKDFIEYEMNFEGLIILSEEKTCIDDTKNKYIYKFQPANLLIKEVFEYTSLKNDVEERSINSKLSKKIIGVYSPINRCKKTTLSIVLGLIYGKSHNVFYLNLEEFSGFSNFLFCNKDNDLSDMLYYYKQNPNNLNEFLTSSTNKFSNFNYLNPITFSKELRIIETSEWLKLIKEIIETTDYEVIILDISSLVTDIFSILDICDIIYMPVIEDFFSNSKILEFENLLEKINFTQIKNKIKKLNLPDISQKESGEKYFENLLKGNFGNYVRENLV